MNRRHGAELGDADFAAADQVQVVLFHPHAQAGGLVGLVGGLTHGQGESLLRIQSFGAGGRGWFLAGEELVLPRFWLGHHAPDPGLGRVLLVRL